MGPLVPQQSVFPSLKSNMSLFMSVFTHSALLLLVLPTCHLIIQCHIINVLPPALHFFLSLRFLRFLGVSQCCCFGCSGRGKLALMCWHLTGSIRSMLTSDLSNELQDSEIACNCTNTQPTKPTDQPSLSPFLQLPSFLKWAFLI